MRNFAEGDLDMQGQVGTPSPFATGRVESKDGTGIGYRKYGSGRPIALLQGGMGSAENFAELAFALAATFTVFVPDRRGRGLSPYVGEYSLQDDIDDLAAVLETSGAECVFGLSTGGLIVLQAALSLPRIRKIAIYEPAISVNGSTPLHWISRYEREMAQGKLAAALVTGMLGPQMGPPITRYLPRPLLVFFASRLLAHEAGHGSGEYLSMRELLPTLHHDGQLLCEMSRTLEHFRSLIIEVLLLNGAKTATFQKASVAGLAKVLPHAQRIEFPGLTHGGAWNYNRQRNPGADPIAVAAALRAFFGAPAQTAAALKTSRSPSCPI